MLRSRNQFARTSVPADKRLYRSEIEATEEQIDALVYEVYGLTEEEIAIVEGRD